MAIPNPTSDPRLADLAAVRTGAREAGLATRRAREAAAPALHVVPTGKRRVRLAGVVATAIFAMMLALTVFQTQLAQYQLEIDRADQAVEIARTRLIELQKQNAVLHSPERVTRAARQQGMVPADTDSYVTVSEQAIIEVARAAGDRLQGDNITSGPDPLAEHKRVKAIIAGATR